MDDTLKTVIKIGAVGAGIYLLYVYLQKSGYWAQWFGGASVSTDVLDTAQQTAFIQYARSLGMTDSQIQVKLNELVRAKGNCVAPSAWDPHSGNCVGGPAKVAPVVQPPAGSTAPGQPVVTTGTPPPIDMDLVKQLTAMALQDPFVKAAAAAVDYWNAYLQQVQPGAKITDLSEVGIRRGSNDVMAADQYLVLRQKAGLSGGVFDGAGLGHSSGYGYPTAEMNPYAWVH